MIADLHVHFPMHVMMGDSPGTSALDPMLRIRGRPLPDKARAVVLRIASRLLSDRDLWSGHRVSVPFMRAGGVGLGLSVLYSPFDEMDSNWPDGPPKRSYFGGLLHQLDRVEEEIATRWTDAEVTVVKNAHELEAARGRDAIALVHCVEGGFHLGDSDEEIDANAAELVRRGVAYVTVAHLFYREVAANAPAIPFLSFLPDRWYDRLLGQPAGEGLTARGRRAIEALYRNRVLIDVSHMRADVLGETLDLLDELDPDATMPVIASHAGYRFGKESYMLDAPTIERIARRDGVIGVILAQHQLNDGLRKRETRTLAESLEVVRRHVDRIAEITGSHRHAALGTDLDGFIKPTTGGVESAADLAALDEGLHDAYPNDAELITSSNAIRVLNALWSLRDEAAGPVNR